MSLIRSGFKNRTAFWRVCLLWIVVSIGMLAQAVSTTTVQGTVYLANRSPRSGTLQVSWPAFTTAANQAVAAGKLTTTIGADGFVSVNLAPNLGSSPAGLYYTAIYHMSDGTTTTEYCFVPRIDPNLVMRSAQPTMTFSRVSASDRYYVRAFDGSTPPNYSEFSAALIFNTPLASQE